MNDELQAQFEDVSARAKNNLELPKALDCLAGMRDAVNELRDAGLNVTLDVRPRTQGAKADVGTGDGVPIANGTLSVDDVKIEFILSQRDQQRLYLRAYVGTSCVMRHDHYKTSGGDWAESGYYGKLGIKDDIKQMVFWTKSENDTLNSFDTPGKTDVATETAVKVTGPLKLKTPTPAST